MERTHGASRITCLWPGLLRLWYQGDLGALAAAIGFAVIVNAVLLATFLPPVPIPASWRLTGWVLLVAFWGVSTWRAFRHREAADQVAQTGGQQDLFIRAQVEYLRGHWVEAQGLLEQQIRHNPHDVESHLLLASVYRRSDRGELSRRQLACVRTHQGADNWRFEIHHELALLDGDAPTGS